MNWTYWVQRIAELETNIGMSGMEATKPNSTARGNLDDALDHLQEARHSLLEQSNEEEVKTHDD